MTYTFSPPAGPSYMTPFYDLIMKLWGFNEAYRKRIFDMAQIQNGESILDVGCGTGSLVFSAKERFPLSMISGIDADRKILEIAKKKAEKNGLEVNLHYGKAEKLPLESSNIDVVISSITFHHLPTDIKYKAFSEIYRVLKKDGRFLLADFGKPGNLFWKILLKSVGYFEIADYLKDNLEGRLPGMAKKTGFTVKDILPKYHGVQFLLCKK